MRKIKTKEEIEEKQNRNKAIIAGVFIALMILSTAGFALFSGSGINNQNVKEYNDIEFSLNENGYWEFQIQGQSFQTSYTPEETKQISADFVSISEISGKPLYFINPEASSLSEIVYNIGRYASRYQEACLENIPCSNSENIVKTCDDNAIIFVEGNESSVTRESNCIFLSSSPGNEVLVSNRLIFKALGVQ